MVNVVLYFPSMIVSLTALGQYQEQSFSSSVFIAVVGAFILLGMAVSFVLFRIANSIVSAASETTEIHPQPTQEFLLQLLGIYFIVSGLSTLPGFSITVLKDSAINTANGLYAVGYVFQVTVGCYLLVKPVLWGQWLNKLRGRN